MGGDSDSSASMSPIIELLRVEYNCESGGALPQLPHHLHLQRSGSGAEACSESVAAGP